VSDREFEGLVALVTGGASGIGAATASLLMARGAQVAVLDRDVTGAPVNTYAVPCDVSDAAAVDAAVAAVVDRFGSLDIVINIAGISAVGDVSANDDAEWQHVLDVNVIGMARIARAALPHLRASEHAAIVNTCSAVAFVGVRNRALYAASKGAVEGLTMAMAADHVREGIRVKAVAPGTASTPWVDRLLADSASPDEMRAALNDRQPLGRMVTAEEVAHAIAHLASPLSASTTGIVLRVDAGMTTLRI
jgi:NAD(P)-dependent dehydrogenase (short-subunit alcohol dehydrogenase family)